MKPYESGYFISRDALRPHLLGMVRLFYSRLLIALL